MKFCCYKSMYLWALTELNVSKWTQNTRNSCRRWIRPIFVVIRARFATQKLHKTAQLAALKLLLCFFCFFLPYTTVTWCWHSLKLEINSNWHFIASSQTLIGLRRAASSRTHLLYWQGCHGRKSNCFMGTMWHIRFNIQDSHWSLTELLVLKSTWKIPKS